MAWKHRLSNMGESALSMGSTGASIGSFAGPKGAAIGGGIGAILGAVKGLFSDTEMQELSERWARGEIPKEVEQNLIRLVGDRFEQLRRDQGGRIARAGIQASDGRQDCPVSADGFGNDGGQTCRNSTGCWWINR